MGTSRTSSSAERCANGFCLDGGTGLVGIKRKNWRKRLYEELRAEQVNITDKERAENWRSSYRRLGELGVH
jgi:hypothetical protein